MSRRIVLVDIGAGLQLLGFLPAASAGEAYSARLTGRGGSAPYTYELVAGALPAGLYLDRDTGTLAGTTTAPGDYAISVRLTDLAGSTLVRHFVLPVTGAVVAPLQLTGDAPAGRVGVVYSYAYSATGGKTPRTFSVASGALPPGLALSAGGLLSGTPTATGNYAWTVRVTDSYGTTADLVDGAAIAYATLTISGSYPAGQVGTAYSADLTLSGGNGVYSNPRFTSGSLPAGLALSIVGNKLRLSGTPTLIATSAFTVVVDSGDGQVGGSEQHVAIGAQTDAVALLHLDPATGSLPFPDAAGSVWSALGGGHISTDQARFGGGSLTGGSIRTPNTDGKFNLPGPYTLECWVWLLDTSAQQVLFAHGSSTAPGGLSVSTLSRRLLVAHEWVAVEMTGDIALPLQQWTHIAVSRDEDNVTRLFVGGVIDKQLALGTQYASTSDAYLGAGFSGYPNLGYLDEFRLIKTCLYRSSFTPPAGPLS